MKPTGKQTIATWLWRCACCLLQCCIGNSSKKGLQWATCTCFSLSGDGGEQRRLVETLSHKEKRMWFFISALTLSVSPPCLSSPSLHPSLLSLHSPHQHNGRISIFRNQTPLEDSHQTFSRRCEHAHTHTQTHSHPHVIRHTIFHIQKPIHTKTHTPKTTCKHTPASVYCHSARERQGEVGGHVYSVHNIAESEN